MEVSGTSVSSSVLPMRAEHVAVWPDSRPVGREDVPVVRLDTIAAELGVAGRRTLLKIDVQGYEAAVLRGGRRNPPPNHRGVRGTALRPAVRAAGDVLRGDGRVGRRRVPVRRAVRFPPGPGDGLPGLRQRPFRPPPMTQLSHDLYASQDRCPACGSDVFARVGPAAPGSTVEVDGRAFTQPPFDARRCGRCHLVFKSAVAAPAVLTDYYRRIDYRRWDTPRLTIPERIVRDVLQTLPVGSRVLDFGCSTGRLLAQVMDRHACFGVEVNAAAAAVATGRGITMLPPDGPPVPPDGRGFDAVVLVDVFEHLDRPVDVLRGLAARLNPGGRLIVSTGNSDAAAVRGEPALFWYFEFIEHLCMLNPSHARSLADALGLRSDRRGRVQPLLLHSGGAGPPTGQHAGVRGVSPLAGAGADDRPRAGAAVAAGPPVDHPARLEPVGRPPRVGVRETLTRPDPDPCPAHHMYTERDLPPLLVEGIRRKAGRVGPADESGRPGRGRGRPAGRPVLRQHHRGRGGRVVFGRPGAPAGRVGRGRVLLRRVRAGHPQGARRQRGRPAPRLRPVPVDVRQGGRAGERRGGRPVPPARIPSGVPGGGRAGFPRVQFAFIDASHLFDLSVLDFTLIDKRLDVGGVVGFHDLWMPSLQKLVRYILTNRDYVPYRCPGRPPADRRRRPGGRRPGFSAGCPRRTGCSPRNSLPRGRPTGSGTSLCSRRRPRTPATGGTSVDSDAHARPERAVCPPSS